VARPTALTPDVQGRICQGIRVGMTYAMAAQYGGVTYESFRIWCRRGEHGRAPYAAFLASVKTAEAQAVAMWLSRVEEAAQNGEWQAAAWKLERRYPRDYGRRVEEITGRVEVVTDGVRDRLAGKLDDLAERRRAKEAAS